MFLWSRSSSGPGLFLAMFFFFWSWSSSGPGPLLVLVFLWPMGYSVRGKVTQSASVLLFCRAGFQSEQPQVAPLQLEEERSSSDLLLLGDGAPQAVSEGELEPHQTSSATTVLQPPCWSTRPTYPPWFPHF